MSVKTTQYKCFDSIQIKESNFKEFALPDHFHDEYCVGLLSNGTKSSIVEGSSYLIHSNSVTIVNPYQIHSDKNIDAEVCNFKMIYLNKEVVNYFTKQINGRSNNNISFTNDLITDHTVSTALLNFFKDSNDESLLENKLRSLIKIIVTQYTIQPTITIHSGSKNAILDSIENARENFSDKIDIAKMANESKLSKFQFIRYFKKMTGLSPAVYIIVNRINYAKKLLAKEIPIGQIALELGFYDHPQFCRFFKYYTNISPLEYKRNCNIIQA